MHSSSDLMHALQQWSDACTPAVIWCMHSSSDLMHALQQWSDACTPAVIWCMHSSSDLMHALQQWSDACTPAVSWCWHSSSDLMHALQQWADACTPAVIWCMHSSSDLMHALQQWSDACTPAVIWCMHSSSDLMHALQQWSDALRRSWQVTLCMQPHTLHGNIGVVRPRGCHQEGLSRIFVLSLHFMFANTVKPLNKGHFGNNSNSSLLSFVERLSSSRRFKMYSQNNYLGPWKASFVERFIILSLRVSLP